MHNETDSKLCKTYLLNSVTSAFAYRKRELRDVIKIKKKSKLYFPEKTWTKIKILNKRVHENILIEGDSGTGKTILARKMAEHLISKYPQHFSPVIQRVDCRGKSFETLEEMLFSPQTGVFKNHSCSVIVLENIQELPKAIQSKIVSIFEDTSAQSFSSLKSKFIFTCSHPEKINLIPGFVSKIAKNKICLPSINQQSKNLH